MAHKPSSDSPDVSPGQEPDQAVGQANGPPLATSFEPGAPISPDAVDPELINLKVPPARRHPFVSAAVVLVSLLLLLRMRHDLEYALLPPQPVVVTSSDALDTTKLTSLRDRFVQISGVPDHRNSVSYDPKGARGRVEVFRLLGTSNRVLVTRKVALTADSSNVFSGRLRTLSDVWFSDALRSYFKQTQVLRALDLEKLSTGPQGSLRLPLTTTDRAGQSVTIGAGQELLIDVLFDDDVRVLLSKEKFPSEADAAHDVERLRLPRGPCVETHDGFGYVLRLPPKGPERQKVLSQIDALGIWLWHRVETYRVPSGLVQVTAEGVVVPGPASMQQPVRYALQPAPAAETDKPTGPEKPAQGATNGSVSKPTQAASVANAPTAPAVAPPATATPGPSTPAATGFAKLLAPVSQANTLLPWSSIQAIQINEPLLIPSDGFVLFDREEPQQTKWAIPVSVLLGLFVLLNLYYLLSLRSRRGESSVQNTR